MDEVDGKWHRSEIHSASIIERPTKLAKVRRFLHRVMPNIVSPPKNRKFLQIHGGGVIRIDCIVPSAEGVRYGGGSTLPLPRARSDKDDFNDPLAVEVGLGVGSQDIPPEGWPDTLKPEVIMLTLELIPDDD